METIFTRIDAVSISSNLESMPIVEALIDKVCNSVGVHEDVYGNVLIAVTEAVNNAIIHGNKLVASALVDVEAFDQSNSFWFTVSDSGLGFDHLHLPDPTAPENLENENGRGVFLMRNLADEVVYNVSGNSVSVYFQK